MKKVILASASPRRRELLSSAIAEFEVRTAETDETLPASVHPMDGVRILAERKGEALYKTLNAAERDAVIISSDTLVEIGGTPLGKPSSYEEAYAMLSSLSGKRHNVHTGIAVRVGDKVFAKTATTGVYFKELTDSDIKEYIATDECWDKAGSYAIQGGAGKFVSHIEGDFDTVVGLSLKLLCELVIEIGEGEVLLLYDKK